MPKQVLQVTNFAGGLNAYSDARDIEDNQFVQNWNAVVDKEGIIRVSGMAEDSIHTDYFDSTDFQKGYGLFQFSADYSLSGLDGQLSTGVATGTISAVDGSNPSYIFTLEDKASTSSVDDYYKDWIIYIYSGTKIGESRKIGTSYTGSSRIINLGSGNAFSGALDTTSQYIIYRWTPSSDFKGDGSNFKDWINGDAWNERYFLTKSGTVSSNESNDLGYIEYEPKLTLTPGVSYNISFECKALERYFNNVSDGISNGTGTTYGDKVPWVHLYSETVADTQGSIKTLTDNTPSPTGGNWESGKTWNNVPQTSTSGTGTGAQFNITVKADNTITVYLTSERGRGYKANDTIVLTDPGTEVNPPTATITVSYVNVTGLSLLSSGIKGIGHDWISGSGRNGDASNYLTNVDSNYINNGDFVESLTAVTATSVYSNESTVSATDSSVTLTVDNGSCSAATNATEANLLHQSLYKSDGTFIGICTAVNSTIEIVFANGVDVDIENSTNLYKKTNGWDIVKQDYAATSAYSSHGLTIAIAGSSSVNESYDKTASSLKITTSALDGSSGWVSQTVHLEENTPYNLNFLYYLKEYGMADYRILNTQDNTQIEGGHIYPVAQIDDDAPNDYGYYFYQEESEFYYSGINPESNFSYIQFKTPNSISNLETIPIKIQFRPLAFDISNYALYIHGVTLQKNHFDLSNMNYLNPQAKNPFKDDIKNYSTYNFNFTVPLNYTTDSAWVFRIHAGKYGYRSSSEIEGGEPSSSQEISIQNIKIISNASETVTLLSDNTAENSLISAYTSSSNSWIRGLFQWGSPGAKPVYDYINGMLKISDGNFNTHNENKLLYYSQKTLPDKNIYPQWVKVNQVIPSPPSLTIQELSTSVGASHVFDCNEYFNNLFLGELYTPVVEDSPQETKTNWPMDTFGPLNFSDPENLNTLGIIIRSFSANSVEPKKRGTLSSGIDGTTINTKYRQLYNPNTQWFIDNIKYQDPGNPNYRSDNYLDSTYNYDDNIGSNLDGSQNVNMDRIVISNLGINCKHESNDFWYVGGQTSLNRNHTIDGESSRNPLSLIIESSQFSDILDEQDNLVEKIKYIDIEFTYEAVGFQTDEYSNSGAFLPPPPVFDFTVGVPSTSDYDNALDSPKSKMINGDVMNVHSNKPYEVSYIGDVSRNPDMYPNNKSIWEVLDTGEGNAFYDRYDSKDRLKNGYIGRYEKDFSINELWNYVHPGKPMQISMKIEDRIEFPANSTINVQDDALLIKLEEIIEHSGGSGMNKMWGTSSGDFKISYPNDERYYMNDHSIQNSFNTIYARFIIEKLNIGFYPQDEESIEIELGGNSVGVNFDWGGEESEGSGWGNRTFEVATTSVNNFDEESGLSAIAGIVGQNEETEESFINIGEHPSIQLKMKASRLDDISLNKTKVYMRDNESDIWFLQFYIDHKNRKLYSSTSSNSSSEGITNDAGEITWSLDRENFKNFNEVNSYESETMVSQEDAKNSENLTARYKASVVANNRLYVGNIKQNDKIQGDRMLKSPIGKYNLLPASNFIDVAINDGDEITALAYYKDKLLQFKKRKVFVINVSGDYEFLEDTFDNVGVLHQASVTKTPHGIVWANKTGCYLYNGTEMTNLIDGKIPSTSDYANVNVSQYNYWFASNFDGDCVIGYIQDRDTLLIKWTAAGAAVSAFTDAITYHFPTQSWIFNFNSIAGHTQASNTGDISNMITDVNGDLLYYRFQSDTNPAYANNSIKKWTNSPLVTGTLKRYTFTTKDFTFGNIANRKKIYKVYVTYKTTNSSNSKILVYAATNGGSQAVAFSASTSKFAGTNTACYHASNGLLDTGGDWKVAELKFTTPSTFNNIYSFQLQFLGSGTVDSGFEINDISIVFKTKRVK